MTINQIVHSDCIKFLEGLDNESIDLFITSPPYNIRNSTGNGLKSRTISGKWQAAQLVDGYDGHSDNMPYKDYVAWQRNLITEMMRCLRHDGAIFYNHKWRVQAGLLQDRSDIVNGFPVRQIIIWDRGSGLNFNPGYFLPSYEVIYLIAKPDFKLRPKANANKDVWRILPETGNPHPAPFPLDLPDRIISSTFAKLVCDPFMGSGTTAIAAIKNGIDYVGCDISLEYVNMANKRIEEYVREQK